MSANTSVTEPSCLIGPVVAVEFFAVTRLDILFDTSVMIAWQGGSTFTKTTARGATDDGWGILTSYGVDLPLDVFEEMTKKPFFIKDFTVNPNTRSFLAGFSRANPCD